MEMIWVQLLLQYAPETVYKIWQMFQSKTAPTDADWKVLIDLGKKTEQEYVDEAIAKLESMETAEPTPVPPS